MRTIFVDFTGNIASSFLAKFKEEKFILNLHKRRSRYIQKVVFYASFCGEDVAVVVVARDLDVSSKQAVFFVRTPIRLLPA